MPICGTCQREVSEDEVAYYRTERVNASEPGLVEEITRIPVCKDCAEQEKAPRAD